MWSMCTRVLSKTREIKTEDDFGGLMKIVEQWVDECREDGILIGHFREQELLKIVKELLS